MIIDHGVKYPRALPGDQDRAVADNRYLGFSRIVLACVLSPGHDQSPQPHTCRRRLRHGEADERKERRALELVAVTFFVLATYVTVEGIRRLATGEIPETSMFAIAILACPS
jgi:hypothetical protein